MRRWTLTFVLFTFISSSSNNKFFCTCTLDHSTPGVTLSADYDKAFPPHPSPVEVSLFIYVQTVAPILTSELEFRVNMRWTLSWSDPRITLQHNDSSSDDDPPDACLPQPPYIIASPSLTSQLWIPDPFIVNSKYTGIKNYNTKLSNLLIFPNHTLAFTMILNATVSCDMDFEFYPMDVQNCPIVVQSFAYDTNRVHFRWKDFSVRNMLLIQFMVVQPTRGPFHRFVQVPLQGNVSQLVATFRFERLISSHIAQSLIPSTLVVTLSWFSFWLELEVTAARGYLLMACILSLQIHLQGLKSEFPPVAYVKAVDFWIFGCIWWIFLALTEFVVIKVIYSVTEQERRTNQVYSLTKVRLSERNRLLSELDNPFLQHPIIISSTSANVTPTTPHAPALLLPTDQTPTTPTAPYSAFWLWQELQEGPHQMVEVKARPPYRKDRLGSVVLSGRSVATSNLPLVEKTISFCGGRISLPLIWSKKQRHNSEEEEDDNQEEYDDASPRRTVLWREIDNWAKLLYPIGFIGFAFIFWAVVVTHAMLVV